MTRSPSGLRAAAVRLEHRTLEAAVQDATVVEQIVDVYRSAFTRPPWNESERHVAAYAARLNTDAARTDARIVLAYDASGAIVAFATAWTTTTPFPVDPPWYGTVARALGDEIVNARLASHAELDEIAVQTEYLGRGIGRRLLDAIAPLDGESTWLATSHDAEAAVALYRSAGWDEITATADDGREVVVFATPQRDLA